MADLRETGSGSEMIAAFGLKSRRNAASWWLMLLSIAAVIACLIWGVDERRWHPAGYTLAPAAQAGPAQIKTAAASTPVP